MCVATSVRVCLIVQYLSGRVDDREAVDVEAAFVGKLRRYAMIGPG